MQRPPVIPPGNHYFYFARPLHPPSHHHHHHHHQQQQQKEEEGEGEEEGSEESSGLPMPPPPPDAAYVIPKKKEKKQKKKDKEKDKEKDKDKEKSMVVVDVDKESDEAARGKDNDRKRARDEESVDGAANNKARRVVDSVSSPGDAGGAGGGVVDKETGREAAAMPHSRVARKHAPPHHVVQERQRRERQGARFWSAAEETAQLFEQAVRLHRELRAVCKMGKLTDVHARLDLGADFETLFGVPARAKTPTPAVCTATFKNMLAQYQYDGSLLKMDHKEMLDKVASLFPLCANPNRRHSLRVRAGKFRKRIEDGANR